MGAMKQKSYHTNPELWRGKGDGGRGWPKEEAMKDKMRRLANRRWAIDTVQQALPKPPQKLPKEDVVTSSIPAEETNGLLQVDTSAYPDAVEAFEKGGIRMSREYIADQIVDRARFFLSEWEDKRDVFIHPAWHAQTPKVTVDMGPDEVEATRRDARAHPKRVFASERWRRARYQERHEDLVSYIEFCKERQGDMYEQIDEATYIQALAREPEPFEDTRSQERAWWEFIRPKLERMTLEELEVYQGDIDNGLEGWLASLLILDRMTQEFRTMRFQWKTQLQHVKITDRDRLGYDIVVNFKSATLESKADEYFALGKRRFDTIDVIRRTKALLPALRRKVETVQAKTRAKKEEAQEAFWGLQEDPFKVVGVLPGQDLTFELDNGEYLEGSMVEVRYELANGMRVSVNQIPEGDLNDADYSEPQEEMWNPVLTLEDVIELEVPSVACRPERKWMKLSDL